MAGSTSTDTGIAAVTHIVAFATSFLGPLIMYFLLDEGFAKRNAANALNWQIMVIIYSTAIGAVGFLTLPLFGIGLFVLALIPIVLLLDLIFCAVAALKASNGEAWTYPITYNFV